TRLHDCSCATSKALTASCSLGSSAQASARKAARSAGSRSSAAWKRSSIWAKRSGEFIRKRPHSFQFVAQPGARETPVSFYRRVRESQRFGCFRHRQPAEETQFHDTAVLWIGLRQTVQRFIQRQYLHLRPEDDTAH